MGDTDVKTEVVTAFTNRLNHPFLFAFAVSWVVFNWDFITFLVLSTEPASIRIKSLRTDYLLLSKSLWFPGLAALGYVMLAPLLKTLIDMYNGVFLFLAQKAELRKRVMLAEHEYRLMKLEALSSQFKMWQELRVKAREEVRAAMQEINEYVTFGRSASSNLSNTIKALGDAALHAPPEKRSALGEAAKILETLVERLHAIEKSSFKLAEIASSFDSFQENALKEAAIAPERN